MKCLHKLSVALFRLNNLAQAVHFLPFVWSHLVAILGGPRAVVRSTMNIARFALSFSRLPV